MKHRFLYIMALLLTVATGAWAQDPDPIDLTPSADGTVWTLSTMPEYDVELEVTYYTDAELAAMAAINDLPDAANVTTANKTAIEAARTAYDALTEAQKTAFPADVLAKLTAAEAALAIAELPAANEVTTANADAITAARTKYNALTDAQKEAVGADALSKLEAAEAALAIANLPEASAVTTANEADITAARTAYNNLTDAQKNDVGNDALAKLQAVEVALAIVSLPEASAVTTANTDAITAARTAYDALTPAQQTAVGTNVLAKLTAAEAALAVAETLAAITALPEPSAVTTTDQTAIEAARAAYDALTDAQKEAVGADALSKLEAAEVALTVALINALPAASAVTTANEADITAARTAYNALTNDQKTAVGTDALAKLQAVEATLAIANLPAAANVATTDADAITAARTAYNNLTDAQKNDVGNDAKAKLEAVEVALAIVSLPAAEQVTAANKTAIWSVLAAYKALSDAQKTAVGTDLLAKLKAAELALGYEVTVPAGEYATFYCGDNLYLDNAPGAQLYTITSVSQTTATTTPLTIAKANTPILVKNTSGETKTIVLIPTNVDADEVTVANEFVGTLEATTIAASGKNQDNYAFNGEAFIWVKDALNVAANKAWLTISNTNARIIKLVFSETTGVSEKLRVKSEASWFTLDGRKLDYVPTKKGMYIKDGIKVVVK